MKSESEDPIKEGDNVSVPDEHGRYVAIGVLKVIAGRYCKVWIVDGWWNGELKKLRRAYVKPSNL